MKALKIAALVIVGLIALVLIVSYSLSDEMHVEETYEFNESPEKVYTAIITPKLRANWDPWLNMDPNAKIVFEGSEQGVGAINKWESEDSSVGVGEQEIVEVKPNEYVKTQVRITGMDPFYSEFFLEPNENGGTKVRWKMDNKVNMMGPMNGIMAQIMTSMVSSQFKDGYSKLEKYMAENDIKPMGSDMNFVVEEMEPFSFYAALGKSTTTSVDMSAEYGKAFGSVMEYMGENNIEQQGMPMTMTTLWDEENNVSEFYCGVPVANDAPDPRAGTVQKMKFDGGTMATVVYTGPYSGMKSAYEGLMGFIAGNGYEIIGSPVEMYMNDPGNTPEEELMTKIAFPVMKKGNAEEDDMVTN
ncbi:MAG: hypothetical protein Kapaf2KO_06740 [Candidatus Kapaibacteriales bacterium]